MQLASMVHGIGRDQRRDTVVADHHHHHHHHHHHQQNLMYTHHAHPQSRALQQHHDVGSCLSSNPYSTHQPFDYSYSRAPQAPQSPPSPPVEEIKPSLPSISSLLGIADGEKGSAEAATQGTQTQPTQQGQQQQQAQQQQSQQTTPTVAPVKSVEYRPDQEAQAYASTIVSNPRMTLPPTPPMHPDTVIDGNQSPSAASSQSSISAQQPYYLGQSLNNMEPHQQRQHSAAAPLSKRHSIPTQSNVSPYSGSQYAASPYQTSPAAASAPAYYSPESAVYPPPSAGLYTQRPLPSNFPPQMPMHLPQAGAPSASNPWQHHHYISHSSQAAFPQSNDRYICTTCNKAFSRPSSLRIHSHSHTGEKPYKCPQPGCGKAFSVRSNMKRHERGCHAASNVITAS